MNRSFHPWDVLYALVAGLLLGMADLPWKWPSWVVAGVFMLWFALRATEKNSA